jgi:hypothetical protein
LKPLIFFLFCLTVQAKSFCNKEESFNSHFVGVTKIVKASGELVSNTPLIAKQADQILSKLIAAKSPLVLKWISKRKFDPDKDEERIVKEWRKYFLENFILSKFPSSDIKINNLIDNSFKEVSKKSFTKSIIKNFNNLLKEAKKDSLNYISNSTLEAKDKEMISKKIQKVELYWFKGLLNSKYEKMPLEFLKWGLAYDPIPNEINVGILALSYNSNEEIYATLLHEIAHAFDPCRWSALVGTRNPFMKVINCLRDKDSAGAKTRDDSKLKELVSSKRINAQMADVLSLNPTCNKSFYPLPGMQRDQILEVFSDWFSAEVLSHSKKYINSKMRKDLCRKSNLSQGSSYIKNEDRLNKIYFANPVISKILNQKSKFKFCSL